MEWLITVYRKKLEPEFSVLIISGKLRKHACLKKNLLIKENLIKICAGDF